MVKRPVFSRKIFKIIFQTVLDIGEKLSCYSGKDGALPFKERRRATIFPRYSRGQKGTPLFYADWIDIICRDASQSSAGAQNAWGFGKGFETAIHPTGCCNQYKFGMHIIIHYNGILFSSNPPLEDLYYCLSIFYTSKNLYIKWGCFAAPN